MKDLLRYLYLLFLISPRFYEESKSKTESETEKEQRGVREQFCREVFFSFISPELENVKPDTKLKETATDEAEPERSVRSIQSSLETLQLDAPRAAADNPCGGGDTAQAASASTNDIVVSKGRNGCESDCVYNGDKETNSSSAP